MDDFYKKSGGESAFLHQGGLGGPQIVPSRSKESIPINNQQQQQHHQAYPPVGMAANQPPTIGFVNPAYPSSSSIGYATSPQSSAFHSNYSQYVDPEDPLRPEVKGFEFSDESIRRGFIRKVYSILSVQLAVTLGFIFLMGYEENTRQFVSQNFALFYTSLGMVFFSLIVMICVESARRKAPLNFIFLGIFTISESYIVGMSTLRFSRDDVLLAIGLTTVICFSLTIFAFQTKWDFTMMGGILFVAVILLMLFGLLAIIMPGKTMILIYSSMGALIFSVYLIYDTQMMMGGTHKYSISPEEYIFAALTIYLDIINIFIYILQIIGAAKD